MKGKREWNMSAVSAGYNTGSQNAERRGKIGIKLCINEGCSEF